jgi:L-asparaginase
MKNIASCVQWPRVEVVLSYAGATGALVDSLVRDGVQGIVVAATGNGTIHRALEGALLRAQAAGVRVVRSTRCPEGQILPKPGDTFAVSRGLSAVKARISLMLELLA